MAAMSPTSTLITRSLRGMNSDLRLTVRPCADTPVDRACAEAALDACVAWLAAFESTCSRFLPDSELCALNASAGVPSHRPFIASPDLFAVVRLAMDYRERTAGLFDPTILPALRAAGYSRSFDEIAHDEVHCGGLDETTERTEITETRGNAEGAKSHAEDAEEFEADMRVDCGGTAGSATRTHAGTHAGTHCERWSKDSHKLVQFDEAKRGITLAPGVALDLGGIAKGWAADVLARRFLAPFPGYLIDLGGDLRVRGGPRDGDPWILGISDPRPNLTGSQCSETYVAGLAVKAGAVTTSGDVRRWWLQDGVRQHHLIDPRTARPATSSATDPDTRVLTYTALAHTTAEADVLAKVAFLRGYPDGLCQLTDGTTCAGVAIVASGRVEASPNLEEYLHALATRFDATQ